MSFVARRGAGFQFAVVLLGLAIIAAIVYEPQAINGGFLSDAWANRANFMFSSGHGFFGKISELASQENIAPRPLQAVYLVLLNSVFGSHVGFWLTWQVATNVGMCAAFYLLLRKLSFNWFDAGFIAALVLVFPAASSTRFWLATIWAPLSLGMVCAGFLVALYAFEAMRTRNKLLLHTMSLLLFVASLLLYEIALLVMLAGVLVYLLRAPWREAVRRWIVDCVVLGIVTVTVTLGSSSGHAETEMGTVSHAREIFSQAKTLAATVILPFNSDKWYVLLLVAMVPAVALLAWKLDDRSDPTRRELRRWLLTMAGGAIVVVLGYVIFAPGTDYYEPLFPGIGNRVNIVPSFGWVLMLYAGAMLASTLALRGMPRSRQLTSFAAAAACAFIAAGWLSNIGLYSGYFTRASEEDQRVLAVIRSAIPDPAPKSTIWTFGQPVEEALGVPVFGNTWDMTSSVRLLYGDRTLESFVAFPGTEFACHPKHMVPAGVYLEPIQGSAQHGEEYGTFYFVDTNTGRTERIESQRQCEAASHEFELSPSLPAP